MAQQAILPTSAAQSGTAWTNVANALTGDGNNYATMASSGYSGEGVLYLALAAASIPSDATIVGVAVKVRCFDPNGTPVAYGTRRTFVVAFFPPNYAIAFQRTPDFTGQAGGVDITLGGPTDLWGTTPQNSFTPAMFNSGTLRLRVGGSVESNEAGGSRGLESASVTVYYTPAGGSTTMPDQAERIASLQISVIGREPTRGAETAPTTKLKAAKVQFTPKTEVVDLETQGDLLPIASYIATNMSEATVGGWPTYDEIGELLASVASKPRSTVLQPGVGRHEFPINSRGVSDPQTFTHELGDANAAERVAHMLLTEFGFGLQRKEPTLTGKAIGKKIQDRPNVTRGAACQQTITLGTATTVQFRLDGATTTVLTGSINAGTIQTALQALSNVGAGNMTVSGTGPFTVTGAGALAGYQLPLIEVAAAGGGTAPTIAYAARGGHKGYACVPIAGGQISVYYAPERGTLGDAGTKLKRLFEGDFAIGNRFAEFWGLDDAETSFLGTGETPMSLGATLQVAADAIAQGMAADAESATRRYIRIQATGPEIGTTGIKRSLTIDMHCQVRDLEAFKNANDVIFAREFGIGARFDPAWGRAAQIVLVNDVEAYA